MSQAISYVNKDSIDKDSVEQDGEALSSIPEYAIAIIIKDELNKETLLTSIANACDFPSYFGHNWDALWDCLTDSDIKHLQLDLTNVKKINTEDFNMFKSIIDDAYKDFGQPQLWIVA